MFLPRKSRGEERGQYLLSFLQRLPWNGWWSFAVQSWYGSLRSSGPTKSWHGRLFLSPAFAKCVSRTKKESR